MTTCLLLAAVIGATLIMVRSTVMARVRNIWPEMLGCAQCIGFWIGVTAGALGLVVAGHGRIVDAIIVGCANSFLSLLANAVLIRLLEMD